MPRVLTLPTRAGSPLAPPARLRRQPKQLYRRRWKPTRADRSAYQKPGVGWIVRSTDRAFRGWMFIPFDHNVASERCDTLGEAMKAGDNYECSL